MHILPGVSRHLAPADVSPAWIVPPAVLLFVLPLAHATALRTLAFLATLVVFGIHVRRHGLAPVPLLPAFSLWVLAALLSLLWALDPIDSLDRIKADLLFALVIFVVFRTLGALSGAFIWLRHAAAASLLFASSAAVVSYFQHGKWIIGWHNALGEYGTFLVTTLPLLATALLPGPLRGSARERLLTATALVAALWAAFLTHSRGLWLVLALLAVCAIAWAMRHANWSRRRAITAALAAATVALIAAAAVSHQRGTALTDVHGRDQIYAFAAGQFMERPFTGVGYGRESNRQAYKEAFPEQNLYHAHNLFLSYAEQMGILGLIAALVLFAGLLRHFRGFAADRDGGVGLLGAAGLALTVAVLMKNMTDMFFYGQSLLLFFAHCGLLSGQAAACLKRPLQILVIRTDNIGDLVCTTPLLRGLRQRFPEAWIGVLASSYSAPALAHHPQVDQVIAYRKAKHLEPGESVIGAYWERLRLVWRLRRQGIDLAVLAAPRHQPSARRFARWIGARVVVGGDEGATAALQQPHEVEQVYSGVAAALQLAAPPGPCEVVADSEAVGRVRSSLPSGWEKKRLVGVHISARKPSQRWPVEYWVELIRGLTKDEENAVLLFWSPGREDDPRHPGDDAKAAAILQACAGRPMVPVPSATLPQLVAGLALCDLVVQADGGAMHLAAGLGKPIVCLFGDSDAAHWHPWGVPFELLQAPTREVADISPDAVLAACQHLRSHVPATQA